MYSIREGADNKVLVMGLLVFAQVFYKTGLIFFFILYNCDSKHNFSRSLVVIISIPFA